MPSVIGKKTLKFGQVLQAFCFFENILAFFPEIFHGIAGVFISTCQQKGIKLSLGGRNGYHFYNIFFVGIFLDGWTAFDTMVLADGGTQCETIQQRRDDFLVRQVIASFNLYIIK